MKTIYTCDYARPENISKWEYKGEINIMSNEKESEWEVEYEFPNDIHCDSYGFRANSGYEYRVQRRKKVIMPEIRLNDAILISGTWYFVSRFGIEDGSLHAYFVTPDNSLSPCFWKEPDCDEIHRDGKLIWKRK